MSSETREARNERVCRPNVFAATDDNDDVSIANFHLAFPPSFPRSGALPPSRLHSPSPRPTSPQPQSVRDGCRSGGGKAIIQRRAAVLLLEIGGGGGGGCCCLVSISTPFVHMRVCDRVCVHLQAHKKHEGRAEGGRVTLHNNDAHVRSCAAFLKREGGSVEAAL